MSDTRIGIYQGAAVAALTAVVLGDDTTPTDPRSIVTFDAVSGETYHVQVGDAPGAGPAPLLLRWYAAPAPPQWSTCDDPGSFVANPSLEDDATGWGVTTASATDAAGRIVGDAAHGSAAYEVVIPTGAGRGIVYTDPDDHPFDGQTTISVWLRAAGGTPRALAIGATGDGTRLVPLDGGADPQVTPTGTWQEFSFSYQPLPGVAGQLVVTIQTVAATGALVLRADCLQALSTLTAPGQPQSLACSPSETAIRLAWDAVPGADGYYVRRDGTLVATVTTPSFVVDALTADTSYTLGVAAFSTLGGESEQATIICRTRAAPSAAKAVDLSCDPLGFLELNGRELGNEARVNSYLAAGLAGPAWLVEGQSCLILRREIGFTPRDPAIDPAPWYDAARPESGDFLGVWPKIRVKRHSTRQVAQRVGGLGGAVIGQNRPAAAEVQVTAALLSRSTAGADYGRRWLENELRLLSVDPCELGTLRLRLACPPDDGTNDTLGEVFLYDVALTGDVQDEGQATSADGCCGVQDVAFSLLAGEASIYHRAQLCAQGTLNPDVGGCIDPCLFLFGPADGSYGTSVACSITSPALFGSVGVIATISAGALPLVGAEIAIYNTPACPPAAATSPVGVVEIPQLPAGGVLVYDSARRILTFYASAADASAGRNAQPGIPYISIPDGQGIPWLEANPFQPAGCIVVGKRALCGGSATVRIDTQLREA